MKKILSLIMVFAMIFSISGCEDTKNEIIREGINLLGEVFKNRTAEKIINAINAEDAEMLKEVLCENLRGKSNLDEQIATAFDFIDEKITDYDVFGNGENKSVREGKVVYRHCKVKIANIELDSGEEDKYLIIYHDRANDAEDENNVGVIKITIYLQSEEEFDHWEYVEIC